MIYTLENDKLTVKIESFGAEIKSVVSNADGKEYMWCADEKYWKRTAPVLFPIVGSLVNGEYEYEGKKYQMSQHGFARDNEFSVISNAKDAVWMELKADAKTLAAYPFEFSLQIGYELKDNQVKVLWRVINNENDKEMYFSIGAHPAFNCPINGEASKEEYGIRMNTDKDVIYARIDENGLMYNTKNDLELSKGAVYFDEAFFDEGVYILEDYQVSEVSLLDADGKPYVTMKFHAPVFGMWSPEKKNAPFVCLEPWYGRCDRATYEGTLSEREWSNKLAPQEVFEKEYTISFE